MKTKLFFILAILVAIPLVNASFEVQDYSILNEYAQGDYLSGYLNISFEGEPATTIVSDNQDNEFTLLGFLNQTDYEYNCSIEDCLSDYSHSIPEETKTFNLGIGDEVLFGFKLTGSLDKINSIEFDLTSNAQSSSTNQLELDILNDGSIDFGNTKASGAYSEVDYGCYNQTDEDVTEITIGSVPYCQKMNLSEAPAYQIGGWIKETTSGENGILMSLYDKDGIFLEECQITSGFSASGSELFCQVNFLNTQEEEYYVCINKISGTAEYKTKLIESSEEERTCGFQGKPVRDEIASYQIGAKSGVFGTPGTIQIENNFSLDEDFSELAQDYIYEKYGSLDCSENCYIPLKLTSNAEQTITLNNLIIEYDKLAGTGLEERDFYSLLEMPSLIDADYQKISISNIFQLNDEEETTYTLSIDGTEIIDEEIRIKNITIGLSPLKGAAGFPTSFQVSTEGDLISKYEWDFGDNETDSSYTSSINHIYEDEGNYTLTLTLVNSKNARYSKEFPIKISSPEAMIGSTIIQLNSNLDSIQSQISKLSVFEKLKIESELNLSSLEKQLAFIESKNKKATTTEEITEVINLLISIEIPDAMIQSSTAKINFYPQENSIDAEIIKEITMETNATSQESAIRDNVLFWFQEKLNSEISMKEFILKKDSLFTDSFKFFNLEITPKTSIDKYYLVLDKDYSTNIEEEFTEIGNYKYLALEGNEKSLTIFTKEDVTISDLDLFAFPTLESLSLFSTTYEEKEKSGPFILILILFALLLIAFFVYLFLKNWYKAKYENYLFPNKNNFYNMVLYVNRLKSKGVEDKKIRSNLKKAGWNSEQITYAMKKYAGKNTGMIELKLKKENNAKNNSK